MRPTYQPTASRQRKGRSEKTAKPAIQPRLDQLDHSIERFRIDAQRFYAGDLKIPPERLREEIDRLVRGLRSSGVQMSVAERFRLGSLEARHNAQLELHNRRLREREVGGVRARVAEPAPDPHQGVVYGQRGADNAVEVLYKGLYQSHGKAPSMDLERFRSYIDRQATAIRSKTGCESIHFRLAVEGGKTKLKARPVRS